MGIFNDTFSSNNTTRSKTGDSLFNSLFPVDKPVIERKKTFEEPLIERKKTFEEPLFNRIKTGVKNLFTKKEKPKQENQQKRSRILDFIAGVGSGGVLVPDKNRENTFAKDILAGIGQGISSFTDITTGVFENIEQAQKRNVNEIKDPVERAKAMKASFPTKTRLSKETRRVSKKIKVWAQDISPENPDFADQLMQGVGSMGLFATANVVSGGSTVVPVILESLSEAGSVYETNRETGLSIDNSSQKAGMTLGLNLVLNSALNVFEVSTEDIKKIAKVLKGLGTEGIQEGSQQIISNFYTKRPIMEGVFESMGVGAVLGGGTVLVLPSGDGGKDKQYTKRKKEVKFKPTEVIKDESKVIGEQKVGEVAKEVTGVEKPTNKQTKSPKYQGTGTGSIRRTTDSGIKSFSLSDETIKNSSGNITDVVKRKLKQIQGNPNAEIVVYRGAPKGSTINRGDWISLDKSIAESFTRTKLGTPIQNFEVIEKKVKASEIIPQKSAGKNSIFDFSFEPQLKARIQEIKTGFEPQKVTISKTRLERIKGETVDQAIAKKVGYQIDNGTVKLVPEKSGAGWVATVMGLGDNDVSVIHGFKKEQVLQQIFKKLYPNVEMTETRIAKIKTPEIRTAKIKPKVKIKSKAISEDLQSLAKEARKYKSAEEFINKSGIVPEWGTLNQYYLKNPFKSQLDKMKPTGKYSLDVIKKASRWELEQLLKDKPAFLSGGNLTKKELKDFAKKHNFLIRSVNNGDVVIAKDIDSLNKVLNAIDGGNQRELGLALGYKDIGILGEGKPRLAKSQLTDIFNKAKDIGVSTKQAKPTVPTPPTLEQVTESQVKTTKDIKGVKLTLRKIRNELSEAIIEAEGNAMVAQEQRSGVNIEDINKLKRIYAVSKKFQEGDIETIRSSKWGSLLNSVVENVQEVHPDMSEADAFDFALNLPTKAQETPRNAIIRELEKKEKKLGKFLDLLKTRQKDLKIKADSELDKEWSKALATQEKLISIIRVPSSQLPVGEGKIKATKLEKRLKGIVGNATKEQLEGLGLSTSNTAENKNQLTKASKHIKENPEEALEVLEGKRLPPEGILKNSIFVAMTLDPNLDLDIATKVAGLSSKRFGQEIQILSNIDKNSPVNILADIMKVRIEAIEKKFGGTTVKELVNSRVRRGKSRIKPPTMVNWSSIIKQVRC